MANETIATEGKITTADLEEVFYYRGVCSECKTCTKDFEDADDAAFEMNKDGWREVDFDIYCSNCVEIAKQRLADEAEEEADGE